MEFHASAVLLDMDGTLVDSTACVERQWVRWAERNGLDAAEILRVCHGRRTEETIRELAPHLATEEELKRFDEEEIAEREGIRAIGGAAALLSALPPRLWAVVTSASRRLAQTRLECAGLPLPSVLIAAEDVRQGKPDPEGYLLAAGSLHAAPADCLVFEDTPAGIDAALAAGMQVLGLTTTCSREQLRGVPCVPDFTALGVDGAGRARLVTITV